MLVSVLPEVRNVVLSFLSLVNWFLIGLSLFIFFDWSLERANEQASGSEVLKCARIAA